LRYFVLAGIPQFPTGGQPVGKRDRAPELMRGACVALERQAGRRRAVTNLPAGIKYLLILLAALAAGPAAAAGDTASDALPPISFGGPFALIDHHGRARTERDFAGRYLLVMFGYARCPDICPTGLATMAAALDRLGAAGQQVQPLFITIDPARDTASELAEYVAQFHPRLVGLTGSEQAVAAAAKAYRVHRRKVVLADQDGPDDYLVDHSSLSFLIGPAGEWLTLFPHGTDPEFMAAAIGRYLGGSPR
jgi:protein SCO1/2